jgi:hypothetical protein
VQRDGCEDWDLIGGRDDITYQYVNGYPQREAFQPKRLQFTAKCKHPPLHSLFLIITLWLTSKSNRPDKTLPTRLGGESSALQFRQKKRAVEVKPRDGHEQEFFDNISCYVLNPHSTDLKHEEDKSEIRDVDESEAGVVERYRRATETYFSWRPADAKHNKDIWEAFCKGLKPIVERAGGKFIPSG